MALNLQPQFIMSYFSSFVLSTIILLTGVSPFTVYAQSTCQQVLQTKSHSVMNLAQQYFTSVEFQKFKMWYLAHFFFQRETLIEQKLINPQDLYPKIYNKNGENPFLSYLIARDYVFGKSIDEILTIEELEKIHYVMLTSYPTPQEGYLNETSKKNSENTNPTDLGTIRSSGVLSDLTESEIKSTIFHIEHGDYENSPKSKKELIQKNLFLTEYKTKIDHADVNNWRVFKKRLSSSLIKKLYETPNLAQSPVLTKDYVTELLSWSLNKLKNDLKHSQYDHNSAILAITEFAHDFISLHPFYNGNGRLIRLLIERLLFQIGLPPPLWTYHGVDMMLTKSEFYHIIKDSILLSQHFEKNILKYPVNDFENYKTVISPFLLPIQDIAQSHLLSTLENSTISHHQILSTQEFQYFKNQCSNCRNENEAVQLYLQWHRKLNHFSNFYKLTNSTSPFIPEEFINNFGDLSKVISKNDYSLDQNNMHKFIYRGLTLERAVNIDHVISYFTKVNEGTIGMGLKADLRTVKNAMISFNRQATSPSGLKKSLFNHWNGGKNYSHSHMTSWSYDFNTASGFSVFDFSSKSRASSVLITAKALKYGSIDADQFHSETGMIPKFGEYEVTTVGAIDPRTVQKVVVTTAHSNPIINGSWLHKSQDRAYVALRVGENTVIVTVYKPLVQIELQGKYQYPFNPNQWVSIEQYTALIKIDGTYDLIRKN